MGENKKKADTGIVQKAYKPNLKIMELHVSEKLYQSVGQTGLGNTVREVRETIMNYIGMNIPTIEVFVKKDLDDFSYRFMLRKVKTFSKQVKEKDIPNVLGNIKEDILKATRNRYKDIVTLQDIVDLMKEVKKEQPFMVKLLLKNITYSDIHIVFKSLLENRVRLGDIYTVLERMVTIVEHTNITQDIVQTIRFGLSKNITQELLCPDDNVLYLMTLESGTEEELLSKVDLYGNLTMEPEEIKDLVQKTSSAIVRARVKNININTMVVGTMLRQEFEKIYRRFNVDINVLSHGEVDPSVRFNTVTSLSLDLKTGNPYS